MAFDDSELFLLASNRHHLSMDPSQGTSEEIQLGITSAGHAHLPKGRACHQCRKKKLRCDAKRPFCAPCTKTHSALVLASSAASGSAPPPPPNPSCTWDDESSERANKHAKSSGGVKVREKGKGREHVVDPGGPPSTSTSFTPYITHTNEHRTSLLPSHPLFLPGFAPPSSNAPLSSSSRLYSPNPPTQPQPHLPPDRSTYDIHRTFAIDRWTSLNPPKPFVQPVEKSSSFDFPPASFASTSNNLNNNDSYDPSHVLDGHETVQGSSNAAAFIEERYPSTLPPPDLLLALVEAFFDKVPTIPKMFDKSAFLPTLLTLSPTHPSYPPTPLLHAICAIAARHCGREEVRSSEGGGFEEFEEKHARFAKEGIEEGMVRGERLVELVMASVVLEAFDHQVGRWVQNWVQSAYSLRLSIPLSLYLPPLLQSLTNPPLVQSEFGATQRPPSSFVQTEDPVEAEQRRRVFWLALVSDRRSVVSSGYVGMMSDERDVEVELPTRTWEGAESSRDVKTNPQTLNSPDVFSFHPLEHTDSFVLHIKAVLLLARVQVFNRRFVSRKAKNVGASSSLDDPRSTAAFQEVERGIEGFRDSFPRGMRDALVGADGTGEGFDADLFLALTIPHVALIYLHGDVARVFDRDDPSAKILLASARSFSHSFPLPLPPLALADVLTPPSSHRRPQHDPLPPLNLVRLLRPRTLHLLLLVLRWSSPSSILPSLVVHIEQGRSRIRSWRDRHLLDCSRTLWRRDALGSEASRDARSSRRRREDVPFLGSWSTYTVLSHLRNQSCQQLELELERRRLDNLFINHLSSSASTNYHRLHSFLLL